VAHGENRAQVAKGSAFLLQGGDCAESFDYCSQEPIEGRVALLLLMSLIMFVRQALASPRLKLCRIHGARLPVVRILRGAGQYAKVRTFIHLLRHLKGAAATKQAYRDGRRPRSPQLQVRSLLFPYFGLIGRM
jgi:3-deoxy-D-arabino-heptulosonate 7-phosphate (DAHP) synthase class II